MKRCFRFFAVLLLLVATVVSAAAVTPRWSELQYVTANLDIASSGRAEFSASARSLDADRLEMTVTLEKDDGSGWEEVKSWSAEGSYVVSKSGSCYVAEGAEYRLVIAVDVYVDGEYVETGEETFDYGWY